MPKLLEIDTRAKASVRLLVAQGKTPTEISKIMARKDIVISARQVANLSTRERWKADQRAVAEVQERDGRKILEQARAAGARNLEETLDLIADDLRLDAQRLKDAWKLVVDGASASSVQRAKNLHFDRVLKLHGLDGPIEPAGSVQVLAQFFSSPVAQPSGAGTRVFPPDSVEVSTNAHELTAKSGLDLDFEDT